VWVQLQIFNWKDQNADGLFNSFEEISSSHNLSIERWASSFLYLLHFIFVRCLKFLVSSSYVVLHYLGFFLPFCGVLRFEPRLVFWVHRSRCCIGNKRLGIRSLQVRAHAIVSLICLPISTSASFSWFFCGISVAASVRRPSSSALYGATSGNYLLATALWAPILVRSLINHAQRG
jgi:hypothetical protein